MSECADCKGKGYIVTGNNDIVCGCPAGDAVKMNVTGYRVPIPGRFLRSWADPVTLMLRRIDALERELAASLRKGEE